MSLTKESSPTGVGTERDYGDGQRQYGYVTGDFWTRWQAATQAPVRKEIDQWELEKNLREYDQTYGRQALLEQVFAYLGAK